LRENLQKQENTGKMAMKFEIEFFSWKFLRQYVLSCMIILFPAFSPIVVNGQSLTASVSRNPIGLDEQFQLTFTFTGNLSSFTPPPLNDFMVLSGPNQTNSIQIINGSYSQSISYSYILQPKKQGTFKIGAGTANSGGKSFQSNPISISVTASSNRNQQQQNQNNISSGSIFIRVSLDKRNVYKGEAVVATFKLYTNVQVVNYSITKMPSFTGFWSQDVEMPKQMTLYNENYNGTPYQVGEIKKVVLYPQQTGTLTIDQMIGECIARVKVNRNRSNNPFDIFNDPFFSDPCFGSGGVREVAYSIKSDPVKITVNELPSGAPIGFNGAVGDFSMESIVDREKLKTNDALNVRVKISGNGNLKLIETPFKDIPQEFESYDPKVNDAISTTARGSSGTKTFEHLLIPRVPGDFEIAPIRFHYFNPEKKEYITLTSPSFKISVEKGKGDHSPATAGNTKADFKIIGRDIKFIKPLSGSLTLNNVGISGTWFHSPLSLLPIAVMIGMAMWKRKQLALRSDVASYKSKTANSMAIKRMKLAHSFLEKRDIKSFYEETGKAIWSYLSDKLQIPASELNKEHVVEQLRLSGVSDETSKMIQQLISDCEYARFAGANEQTDPSAIYDQTIKTITDADKELAS